MMKAHLTIADPDGRRTGSVLLYGSTTWTFTKQPQAALERMYTRMLKSILKISWKKHSTKNGLSGKHPNTITSIRDASTSWALVGE